MKKLEQLSKKQLIELIVSVRPKAEAYDRVCESLSIKDNLLKEFERIKNKKRILIDFVNWYREDDMSTFTPEHLAEWFLKTQSNITIKTDAGGDLTEIGRNAQLNV